MKRAYLASQFHVVGQSIGAQITADDKAETVFITTPIKYKVFKESELGWHYKNRAALKESGFVTEDYDITNKSEEDLNRDLAKYRVMYVEGGNPFSTLKIAQTNNFAKYVRARVEEGMIYISESAGSVLAGIDVTANSRPGKGVKEYGLTDTKGIGLINAVIMPHWGQGPKRDDYIEYKYPQAYTEDFSYIFLPDTKYIEVSGVKSRIIDTTKKD
ncbi:Type 1 glutamine amidotransferase-like domain-containing protein [Candidatus Woesebacteria bacterium]|nr:Type 1 glutamine amidotransferase-like domain-containing protein [Candidatus Woesebacteria bacterium]